MRCDAFAFVGVLALLVAPTCAASTCGAATMPQPDAAQRTLANLVCNYSPDFTASGEYDVECSFSCSGFRESLVSAGDRPKFHLHFESDHSYVLAGWPLLWDDKAKWMLAVIDMTAHRFIIGSPNDLLFQDAGSCPFGEIRRTVQAAAIDRIVADHTPESLFQFIAGVLRSLSKTAYRSVGTTDLLDIEKARLAQLNNTLALVDAAPIDASDKSTLLAEMLDYDGMQERAAATLVELGGPSASGLAAHWFMHDDDTRCMSVFRKIGKPAVAQLVLDLRSENARRRSTAARALPRLMPDSAVAVPDLIEAVKDSDTVVRANAVLALGKMGPLHAHEAIPAITEALQDSDPLVRRWAESALKALRKK